jgi:hypothetical protein
MLGTKPLSDKCDIEHPDSLLVQVNQSEVGGGLVELKDRLLLLFRSVLMKNGASEVEFPVGLSLGDIRIGLISCKRHLLVDN